MTRTRLSLISSTAVASLLGAALPAFAQAPAPAPMYAPAPAPMMAPPVVQEPMPVMPVAPVMAPKASDDMTGSVGFGTGVVSGSSVLKTDNTVAMKYWMSDAMALIPKLTFTLSKTKDVKASWSFAPEVLASFVLLKGASTRLSAGLGLGFGLSKSSAATDTTIDLYVPIQLGVEHFFARWFSMGIGVGEKLLDFSKTGTPWTVAFSADSLQYMASLFVYTD